jgi:hypothetical protein
VKNNIKCNICLFNKGETIYKDFQPINEFRTHKITLSICKKCGFLFQNPNPTIKFLSYYYSKNINSSGNIFFERKNLKKTKYYDRYQFLKKYFQIKDFKNILEIGSSNSSFLKILSDRNRNLTGIDPSAINLKNIKIIKKFFTKIFS